MNNYRYLFKNIGLLTLSQFATKLLSFFLVPLYTSVLSTIEYGTFDLFNTTIGVLLPILTLNIQESVLRFAIDKKSDKKSIATIGTKYLLISSLIVIVGVVINRIFGFSKIVSKYALLFFFMFFVQALSGIMTAYTRGVDKIKELSISSVLASFTIILSNILLLVVFKMGFMGYCLANIIGPTIQCLYLVLTTKFIANIDFRKNYSDEEKKMTDYSKPLITNSVAWWVNNSSDRYIVIFFCGLAENGIYSVASKIPSIMNIFQTIFNQAWTLSAVKDFDADDSTGFFSRTYGYYNCIMTLACSSIIVVNKILAKLLYAKDFYEAWRYVPWLTIAVLFGALSGYLGGLFAAVKDSKIFAKSSIVGAVINIAMNLVLTPFMGPMGAAIATTVCYFIVWWIRLENSKQYITLDIQLVRDLISYVIILIQAIVSLFFNGFYFYMIQFFLFLCVLIMYIKDIIECVRSILLKLKRR